MSSAPFFFCKPASFSEQRISLGGENARHLAVRRARQGDSIEVSDGAGRVFDARLEEVGRDFASAAIVGTREVPPFKPRMTVLQGLSKGTKVDWVVEKLVELGVDEIVVFVSGRSIPNWDAAKAAAALARWKRVALAAAKQSRRAWLPKVDGPLAMSQALYLAAGGPQVLIAEPGAGTSLRQAMSDRSGDHAEGWMLVIGPEGGLEEVEVDAFVGQGARAVDLGSQILRTETAPIALASVVMFELGRFG